MKNHTVVQLKAIAKERVIRGCYKLRKAELVHALEAARLVEQKVSYLMSRFQTTPVLQPTPSNIALKVKHRFVGLVRYCKILVTSDMQSAH